MLAGLVRSLFGAKPVSARPYFGFVTDIAEPQQVTPATTLHSTQAGFRLRTMIAARRMAREYPVCIVPARLAAQPGGLDSLGAARAIFIGRYTTGKMGKDHDVFVRLMHWLNEKNPRILIVADITDDFDVLPLRDADTLRSLSDWRAALLRHCHITVTCNALRESLAPRAAHGITVIEDPYEAAELAPWRAPGGNPIRICWLGNTSKTTLPSLAQSLGAILARYPDAGFSIELVTAARWEMVGKLAEQLAASRPGVEFVMTEWSLEATWRALERCDFVLLPHAWRDPWVLGKSHNRLVAAIAAGRFALASPISSYLELGDYAWVEDDLAAGIAWASRNPAAAQERVARGQAHIARHFSPAAIAEKWAQVLG
jgi:glycosyltransferase involved in cell wall biosynthesis